MCLKRNNRGGRGGGGPGVRLLTCVPDKLKRKGQGLSNLGFFSEQRGEVTKKHDRKAELDKHLRFDTDVSSDVVQIAKEDDMSTANLMRVTKSGFELETNSRMTSEGNSHENRCCGNYQPTEGHWKASG
jgi:hypothetical protein